MKKLCYALILVVLALGMVNQGGAQTLEERVKKFGEDYTRGYVGPFWDAFGASLNSGWYHSANLEDGLDLFIGAKVMLMPVPDESKTFTVASPFPPYVVQTVPTIFGEETGVTINGDPGSGTYPDGVKLSFAVMAVPHFSIGNLFGTRVMLRWLPTVNVRDYGEISFFGMGAQHGLNQYLPMLPLDISGMIAFQNMKVGDLLSAKAFTFGAQASKSLSVLTLYGGLAYESSTLSVSYIADLPNPQNPAGPRVLTSVGFDISGKNNFRATVGLALNLAIIRITADYSLASQPVATAGVGLGW